MKNPEKPIQKGTIDNPLKLKWDEGSYQYKVNLPRDQSGEYVPVEIAREMYEALSKISKWKDFPDTGKFWDADKKEPMSYRACWGSNGERDFMRVIAYKALAKARGEK